MIIMHRLYGFDYNYRGYLPWSNRKKLKMGQVQLKEDEVSFVTISTCVCEPHEYTGFRSIIRSQYHLFPVGEQDTISMNSEDEEGSTKNYTSQLGHDLSEDQVCK